MALTKLLKEQLDNYVTLKVLKQEYKSMCKKFGKEALKHTQFWLKIKNLSQKEIISSTITSAEPKGRTTLISLLNIPAEQLYNEIKERLKL